MQDIKVGDKVRVVVDKLSINAEYVVGSGYSTQCKGLQLEVVHIGTFENGVKYIECLGPGWGRPLRQTIYASDVEVIEE